MAGEFVQRKGKDLTCLRHVGTTCLVTSQVNHMFHLFRYLNYYMCVTFLKKYEICKNQLNSLEFIHFLKAHIHHDQNQSGPFG
jgi:hypothetical protein